MRNSSTASSDVYAAVQIVARFYIIVWVWNSLYQRMLSVVPPRIPSGNLLLAALPQQERQQLFAHCQQADLAFGEVLCASNEPLHHVYFPTSSIISLVTTIDEHTSLEVGLIGNEGMLGLSLMLGVHSAPLHAIVQGAGLAWRMDAATFCHQLERSPPLQDVLNRYFYITMDQLARTAACTRFHVLESRLARWFLMTRDRAHSDDFRVKQEFLAYLLGVRRAGINRAASSLQDRKLICYSRGDLHILNGRGLEDISCNCYAADKEIYAQVMA